MVRDLGGCNHWSRVADFLITLGKEELIYLPRISDVQIEGQGNRSSQSDWGGMNIIMRKGERAKHTYGLVEKRCRVREMPQVVINNNVSYKQNVCHHAARDYLYLSVVAELLRCWLKSGLLLKAFVGRLLRRDAA